MIAAVAQDAAGQALYSVDLTPLTCMEEESDA
jgi:hypothetical protein